MHGQSQIELLTTRTTDCLKILNQILAHGAYSGELVGSCGRGIRQAHRWAQVQLPMSTWTDGRECNLWGAREQVAAEQSQTPALIRAIREAAAFFFLVLLLRFHGGGYFRYLINYNRVQTEIGRSMLYFSV